MTRLDAVDRRHVVINEEQNRRLVGPCLFQVVAIQVELKYQ